VLEFKVQVCLKYLILIDWIDTDVADAPGTEVVVDPPGICVAQVEHYGISQHVPSSRNHALHVHPAIEEVRIDEVRIQRILVCVLLPAFDLPIVLLL